MIADIFFWSGLVVSLTIGWLYFRDLGDVVQMVLKVKRNNTVRFIRNEHKLLATGLAAAALMILSHWLMDAGPNWAFRTTLVLILLFYGFTYFWVHFVLRNQRNSASYFSIDEASQYVNSAASVVVIENDGTARAHPDAELLQPHLAGDDAGLDGENVIMTYCGMANLGVGYTPAIDGEPLELTVLAQHGNNLIMRDDVSREPIQQIYGYRERDGRNGPTMTPWPTFRMTFRGFRKAYPDGVVFLRKPSGNPVIRLLDFATGVVLSVGISMQHRFAKPVMDNMTHKDDRLPTKDYVWGINIGDDAVCFTEDFLLEQGRPVNITLGGKQIVIYRDPVYESIGAYYNDSGNPITEIDFFGNTPAGRLPRVEMLKSGLFWHVWVEFFPHTEINKLQ